MKNKPKEDYYVVYLTLTEANLLEEMLKDYKEKKED